MDKLWTDLDEILRINKLWADLRSLFILSTLAEMKATQEGTNFEPHLCHDVRLRAVIRVGKGDILGIDRVLKLGGRVQGTENVFAL